MRRRLGRQPKVSGGHKYSASVGGLRGTQEILLISPSLFEGISRDLGALRENGESFLSLGTPPVGKGTRGSLPFGRPESLPQFKEVVEGLKVFWVGRRMGGGCLMKGLLIWGFLPFFSLTREIGAPGSREFLLSHWLGRGNEAGE